MKGIRYYGRAVGRIGTRPDGKPNTLEVVGFDLDQLMIRVPGAEPILLDAVQVDKLRQQFHEWLHERALSPGGFLRWEVTEIGTVGAVHT